MAKALSTLVFVFSAVALSGCGHRMFAMRPTNPVMEDKIRGGDFKDHEASIVSTRAERRTILLFSPERFCAEPPPEVAEAVSSQLLAQLSKGDLTAGAGASLTTAVMMLAQPSQGLQLFRQASFANCNMFLINGITAIQYYDNIKASLEAAERLIAAQLQTVGSLGGAGSVVKPENATDIKLNPPPADVPDAPDKPADKPVDGAPAKPPVTPPVKPAASGAGTGATGAK
jgi:hypothetical protein